MTGLPEIVDASSVRNEDGFGSFDSLIHPKTREDFFEHYWETRPFVHERDVAGYFDDVLKLSDIDFYLGTRAFQASDIRIVQNGATTTFDHYAKGGVADRAKVIREFRDGATVVLAHLNRHHLPLAELLCRCEAQTHVPLRSNVYLSPPGSQGFNLHWDTHDVLVLQISGAKRWHIHESPFELPHEEQQRQLKDRVRQARKLDEVVLRPGSVLFLPRGFVHAAESEAEHSLHITLGLRSLTIADVILRAFRSGSIEDLEMRRLAMLDGAPDEAATREAKAVLRRVIENLDIEGAAADVYRSFIRSRQPPAPNALLDAIQPVELHHDHRLRVRRDALFQTFRTGDQLTLAVDGVEVKFPAAVESAIDHVRACTEFTPASIPGLEHHSKLILARSLLQCRLLEMAE